MTFTVPEDVVYVNVCRKANGSRCHLLQGVDRYLPQIPEKDSTLLACAYFQVNKVKISLLYIGSCDFVFNERLSCGIQDFADTPKWLEVSKQLDDANVPTLSSLRDLYKAKLLRFALSAKWDPEFIEASGTGIFDEGLSAFGEVFTPALPETAWTQMRKHLNNSAVSFRNKLGNELYN
ncbi:unnamed protein product [Hydatigera taeniaeformis]|uniref:Uncharacterized protein n=1 Tax=Hydatigena taeniaeformis TaxID=6205 RepID=A0A0R3WST3_HYDTA|nr:unnamed protein product [Hydatigera taeniaeformis]